MGIYMGTFQKETLQSIKEQQDTLLEVISASYFLQYEWHLLEQTPATPSNSQTPGSFLKKPEIKLYNWTKLGWLKLQKEDNFVRKKSTLGNKRK